MPVMRTLRFNMRSFSLRLCCHRQVCAQHYVRMGSVILTGHVSTVKMS